MERPFTLYRRIHPSEGYTPQPLTSHKYLGKYFMNTSRAKLFKIEIRKSFVLTVSLHFYDYKSYKGYFFYQKASQKLPRNDCFYDHWGPILRVTERLKGLGG